jgi:hypothetical protein
MLGTLTMPHRALHNPHKALLPIKQVKLYNQVKRQQIQINRFNQMISFPNKQVLFNQIHLLHLVHEWLALQAQKDFHKLNSMPLQKVPMLQFNLAHNMPAHLKFQKDMLLLKIPCQLIHLELHLPMLD